MTKEYRQNTFYNDIISNGEAWDESKHPRDKDGKFTDKGGSSASGFDKEQISAKNTKGIHTVELSDNSKSFETLLGKEFTGVKGQAAIDKLMKEKQGHVKAAFHRDDIGDIDLLWGDDTLGIQHILMRREEQNIDSVRFMQDIAEVVEQGQFIKKNKLGRFEFWHNKKMVVISLELRGNKLAFLLTAYKRTKK